MITIKDRFNGNILKEIDAETLREADLREADLRVASLRGADLQGADLQGAKLQGADLQEAKLQGADLQEAKLPNYLILPDGDLIVWKKLRNGIICKLQIPADVKRINSLIGRKCRAEKALVLDGNGFGQYNGMEYKVGEWVIADSFDDDIRIECSHGIHFFITKEEAEYY